MINEDEDRGSVSGGPSLAETFEKLAETGVRQASDGLARLLSGRPVGSEGAPEANRAEVVGGPGRPDRVASQGIDGVLGAGFEAKARVAAAEMFEREHRLGRAREGASRDRE